MARYKHVTPVPGGTGKWIDTETGTIIHNDPDNADHRRVLKWIEEGGEPDEADPPPVQYSVDGQYRAQVRTTSGAPVELYRATIPRTIVYDVAARFLAVDKGNNAVKKFVCDMTIKRATGLPVRVGTTTTPIEHADPQTEGWTAHSAFDGNDFVIQVQGVDGHTIEWSMLATVNSYNPAGVQAQTQARMQPQLQVHGQAHD